jgi:hypothetical protein
MVRVGTLSDDDGVARQLTMWVVYDHPSDMPEYFVARLWHIAPGMPHPTMTSLASLDLETVRQHLRDKGLDPIPRVQGDDPVILECWL